MPDYPPKMQFDNGVDYILTIADDPKPFVHEKYGEQMIYSFSHDGVMKTHFASGKAMGLLSQFKVGDTVKMGKHQSGDYWAFDVTLHEGGAAPSSPVPTQPTNQPTKPPVDWDLKEAKKEYEIRKSICMKLAVDKIPEGTWTKKTEEEIAGKYTTLMLIMSDDLAIVIAKLRQASGVIHLNAMWQKYSHLWENLLSKEDFAQAIDLCAKIKAHYSEPKKPSLPEAPEGAEDYMAEELPF